MMTTVSYQYQPSVIGTNGQLSVLIGFDSASLHCLLSIYSGLTCYVDPSLISLSDLKVLNMLLNLA